jgi:glycolate oxidase FAD binding subunit
VNATEVSFDLVRELRGICGDEYVREGPSGGVYVSPASTDEVAAILVLANQHRLAVGPVGGLTERNAAELHVDILLHLNRLTQIDHYDHADLTVGVGAGTTISQLNAMVGTDNLMFAGDPSLPERCTVGELLATAGHGPLRHGYGAVRDYCIGVHFVTGDGRRAKGGGRVVKNVAGYDLMKLLIGSYGTLAVITCASFKLFPAPRQTRTFLAEFVSAKEAVAFRDRVVRSPLSPMCLELVSPVARKMMRPERAHDAWLICVRGAGSDAVLRRYQKELGSAITRELEGDEERRMWRALQDFPQRRDRAGDDMSWDTNHRINIAVPPRDAIRVIETLQGVDSADEVEVGMTGRIGVGHIQALVWDRKPGASDALGVVVDALRGNLDESITMKVDGAANPWPIAPANLASMRAVKHALDPNNVLRGRDIF